jgi:3-oxoadipate CoA-transferase alpha subunit
MIDKRFSTVARALQGIASGATVMIGGFGEVGAPERLIDGLLETGVEDLTVIANNAGAGERGIAALIREGRVRKIVCSYPRVAGSVWFQRAFEAGRVELEIVAQGTLSEQIRAAGAGIPAFFTPTGVGTVLALGRETREFEGREYLLERARPADVALLKARRADRWGNLDYHLTARNFAPSMATAAQLTIVESAEIIELGAMHPETVITPGIFVDRVVGPSA